MTDHYIAYLRSQHTEDRMTIARLASRLEQAERTLAAVRLVHRDCDGCPTCAAMNPPQPQEKK